MRLKVYENVREWTLLVPSDIPFWELESRWPPESSKSDYMGQNSLDWRFPYIIEKLLERRCLKCAHMTHLNIWKHKLWPKKGQESN
jgi:hypothetical protein